MCEETVQALRDDAVLRSEILHAHVPAGFMRNHLTRNNVPSFTTSSSQALLALRRRGTGVVARRLGLVAERQARRVVPPSGQVWKSENEMARPANEQLKPPAVHPCRGLRACHRKK